MSKFEFSIPKRCEFTNISYDYYERPEDREWFESLHPLLQTPQWMIDIDERRERAQRAASATPHDSLLATVEKTPRVKERRKGRPGVKATKLTFDDSFENEVDKMLREHNEKILKMQATKKQVPPETEPAAPPPPPAKKPNKRVSCLPLLAASKKAPKLVFSPMEDKLVELDPPTPDPDKPTSQSQPASSSQSSLNNKQQQPSFKTEKPKPPCNKVPRRSVLPPSNRAPPPKNAPNCSGPPAGNRPNAPPATDRATSASTVANRTTASTVANRTTASTVANRTTASTGVNRTAAPAVVNRTAAPAVSNRAAAPPATSGNRAVAPPAGATLPPPLLRGSSACTTAAGPPSTVATRKAPGARRVSSAPATRPPFRAGPAPATRPSSAKPAKAATVKGVSTKTAAPSRAPPSKGGTTKVVKSTTTKTVPQKNVPKHTNSITAAKTAGISSKSASSGTTKSAKNTSGSTKTATKADVRSTRPKPGREPKPGSESAVMRPIRTNKPLRETQQFNVNTNILAIINQEPDPATFKPPRSRYSVETPSPRLGDICSPPLAEEDVENKIDFDNCDQDDDDDDDIDSYLLERLREHNAKILAKQRAGHRIPGEGNPNGNPVDEM